MPRLKQPSNLNIKNPEVYVAAAKLARLQRTSLTGAVLGALREALKRAERRPAAGGEIARMKAMARSIAAMPIRDTRSEDEILGYGPGGYPDGD